MNDGQAVALDQEVGRIGSVKTGSRHRVLTGSRHRAAEGGQAMARGAMPSVQALYSRAAPGLGGVHAHAQEGVEAVLRALEHVHLLEPLLLLTGGCDRGQHLLRSQAVPS